MSKKQVTHDNWGYPPFNRESFQNVQGLFPTARLKRGSGPASDIPMNLHSIEAVEFENLEGPLGDTSHYSCDVHMIKNLI